MLRINTPDVLINVVKDKMEIREPKELEEFIYSSPLMKKIRDGEGVTSAELLEIESKLRQLNPLLTIENIQQSKDFVLFLRELTQIKDLPDPQEMIKWEFDKFVNDRNKHYTSGQLKFLRLLEQVFIRAKRIELKDLAEHPLADARPLDLFTKVQLEKIVQKCNKLRWK
jgi:type I restriction enzyme R subunit